MNPIRMAPTGMLPAEEKPIKRGDRLPCARAVDVNRHIVIPYAPKMNPSHAWDGGAADDIYT